MQSENATMPSRREFLSDALGIGLVTTSTWSIRDGEARSYGRSDRSAANSERGTKRASEANELDDVSADGLTALCVSDESGAVFAVRLDAGPQTQATPVVDTGAEVYGPRFSPDGRWVVYGERNGTPGDIFVQPFPGGGARRQIASIGRHVVWRGDGREILFTSVFEGQTWVTSVQVKGSGADLRFSEPARLFVVRPGPGVTLRSAPLAVSRDGSRIFYTQAVEPSEESKAIHVSTAWMK